MARNNVYYQPHSRKGITMEGNHDFSESIEPMDNQSDEMTEIPAELNTSTEGFSFEPESIEDSFANRIDALPVDEMEVIPKLAQDNATDEAFSRIEHLDKNDLASIKERLQQNDPAVLDYLAGNDVNGDGNATEDNGDTKVLTRRKRR